jgi:hypothetical protein
MLTWNPKKYSDSRREFGYTYSELFIREYLKDNSSALHKVYENLLGINKRIENENERNKVILNILGREFKPCYSKDLQEIKTCTKELNEMNFSIPKVDGKEINYQVETPKLPDEDYVESISNSANSLFQQIINFFNTWIQQILNLFRF